MVLQTGKPVGLGKQNQRKVKQERRRTVWEEGTILNGLAQRVGLYSRRERKSCPGRFGLSHWRV